MAEKKTTPTKKSRTHDEVGAKKITKKPVEKKEFIEEVKTPIFPIAQDLIEDIAEDDISEEIAKTIKETAGKSDRYFRAIGRRKTAVARVRLFTRGDKEFIVNNKPYQQYFQTTEDQETAVASMKKMKCLDKFRITVIVKGGGHRAQAEAIRHGTARVLVDFNQNFRKRLRKAGFLTRDARMRERKKFGLKRARKAPQWAKR
jgi:small subunit ribosomal protein S9